MTTVLDKTLKRMVKVGKTPYVVALSPEGLKITLRGHRNGVDLKWSELVSGDAALAVALNASVGKLLNESPPSHASRKARPTRHPRRASNERLRRGV